MSGAVQSTQVPTKQTVRRLDSKRGRQEGDRIIRHQCVAVIGEGIDVEFGEDIPENEEKTPICVSEIM